MPTGYSENRLKKWAAALNTLNLGTEPDERYVLMNYQDLVST